MKYQVVSHFLKSLKDEQLQQFEDSVQSSIDRGWKPLGSVQITQRPAGGYRVSQAMTCDD
jgi:hypothetical protein